MICYISANGFPPIAGCKIYSIALFELYEIKRKTGRKLADLLVFQIMYLSKYVFKMKIAGIAVRDILLVALYIKAKVQLNSSKFQHHRNTVLSDDCVIKIYQIEKCLLLFSFNS